MRSLRDNKNDQEYCAFVAEMFNKTFVKESRDLNGKLKYHHEYKLPRGEEVCRKVFLMSYGFSKDDFDTCSALRKQSENGRIAFEKHFTAFNDSHIPDMTYFEVANLFVTNTKDTGNKI